MGESRADHASNPHLQGLKFFAPLLKLLSDLRNHRPNPNRTLHFDDYLIYLLLVYYNPVFQSLRGIVALSDSPRVQGNLGLRHTSLGSFSAASSTFDPELLRHLFLELSQRALAENAPARPDGLPEDLKVLAADATLWRLLPRMARALFKGPLTRARKGLRKGHFLFNVLRGVPEDVTFTDGVVDERHVLPGQVESGAMYVLDRGYCSMGLYTTLLKKGASFLVRLRQDSAYRVVTTHSVSDVARERGVVRVEDVRIGGVERELRVVWVRRVSPPPRNLHAKKKGGKHGSYEPGVELEQEWVLLSDRMDFEPELLVELYAYRWHIETFFRWFKVTLQCSHLLAETENGMDLQFYAALIATLLVVIHTQRTPTKGLLRALHLYLIGWYEWEQLEKEIERCKLERK